MIWGLSTALLVALLVLWFVLRPKPISPLFAQKVIRRWQEEVIAREALGDLRTAIINADSIFDAVLKFQGIRGETLGERLKNLRSWPRAELNPIWEVHKLRNRLVHDFTVDMSENDGHRAIKIFARALKRFGIRIKGSF